MRTEGEPHQAELQLFAALGFGPLALGQRLETTPRARLGNDRTNLSFLPKSLAQAETPGMPAVGGSDAHCPGMLGLTANHIDAHDTEGVLRQIRKGKVRIEGRYAPVPVVVSWARERMSWSYDDILKYVEKNYSVPKAAVARFMLKRFVNSDSRLWDGLGYLSIGVSVLYSSLKTMKY